MHSDQSFLPAGARKLRSIDNMDDPVNVDKLQTNKELVLEVALDGWRARSVEKVCSIGYKMHFGNEILDRAGLIDFMDSIHSALSELYFDVEDIIAEGDKVVTRWKARGLHTAPFQGVPPSFRTVEFTGITISHLVDGKIVEDWEEVDQLNFARQFGAFPEEEND